MPRTGFTNWLLKLHQDAETHNNQIVRDARTADILGEAYSQGVEPTINAVAAFQCQDRSFLRGEALEQEHSKKLTRRSWMRQAA